MNITTEKATKEDINTILNFMQDYYIIEKKEMKKEKSRKAIIDLLSHEGIGTLWIIRYENIAIGYYCLAYNYSLELAGRDCF